MHRISLPGRDLDADGSRGLEHAARRQFHHETNPAPSRAAAPRCRRPPPERASARPLRLLRLLLVLAFSGLWAGSRFPLADGAPCGCALTPPPRPAPSASCSPASAYTRGPSPGHPEGQGPRATAAAGSSHWPIVIPYCVLLSRILFHDSITISLLNSNIK